MLNISKTSKYALKGIFHLLKNRNEGFIKIDRIAAEEKIPLNYLRKIFQQLIIKKIVSSGVGPRGGVKLPDNNPGISIADIIAVFDGQPDLTECTLFGVEGCPMGGGCPIHRECARSGKAAWEKLKQFNMQNLLTEGGMIR